MWNHNGSKKHSNIRGKKPMSKIRAGGAEANGGEPEMAIGLQELPLNLPPMAPRVEEPKAGTASNGERWTLDKATLLKTLLAFKTGDFSARMPVDLEGVDGKIADALNEVIERNERMSRELERMGRVVGKEGKISQRASIGEVTGAWEDCVDCVNTLIEDLVHPTSETARVIGAVAKGDLSQKMALEIEGRPVAGEFLRTAKTVNTMVEQLGSFASGVTRVARA